MRTVKRAAVVVTVLTGAFALTASAWSFGDRFGFRPALKLEVQEIRGLASENSRQLMWLRFDALDRIKKHRQLTRQECALYLELARQLGIPASC